MTYPVQPTPTTPLPEPPNPADRSTFNTLAYPWSLAQEQLREELDTLAEETFQNAEASEGYAAQAQSGLSNFQGDYSGATTYLKGQSVYYAGSFWFSLQNSNLNHTPSPSSWWYELGLMNLRLPKMEVSVDTEITAGLLGRHIVATTALTLTASDPELLEDGFGVTITADGGRVRIEVPFADGRTYLSLSRGDSCVLATDGEVFWSILNRTRENPIEADIQNYLLTMPATLGTVASIRAIDVDSTWELHLIAGATNLFAVARNKVTKVFGTPVTVRAAAVGVYCGMGLVDTNKVIVASHSGGTVQAVALTLSAGVITVHTAVSDATAGSAADTFSVPLVLGGALIIGGADATPRSWVRSVIVSGTTCTLGTLKVTYNGGASIAPLLWNVGGSLLAIAPMPSSNIECWGATISGGVLTWGSVHTINSSPGAEYVRARSWQFASGRVGVVHGNTVLQGNVVSVSGTTVSSSSVTLNATASSTAVHAKVVGNQILVAGGSSGVNVLTDSAGTAVAGTALVGINSTFWWGMPEDVLIVGDSNCGYWLGISGNNPVLLKMLPRGASDGSFATPAKNPELIPRASLQGAEWSISLTTDASVLVPVVSESEVRRVSLPMTEYNSLGYRVPGQLNVLWTHLPLLSTNNLSLTRLEIA